MNYYRYKNEIIISNEKLNFEEVTEKEVLLKDKIYAALFMPPLYSKKTFCVSDEDMLFQSKESIDIVKKNFKSYDIPNFIKEKINKRKVQGINLNSPNWEDVLSYNMPSKWRVNIAGLGDVGGMLLCGLKLLGKDIISSIGIYDIDDNKVKRYVYETNEILSSADNNLSPFINAVNIDEIFNCDIFIFCVTAGIPKIDENCIDVRMAQYEKNLKIIKEYAKKAREVNFKGIFAVVSDPVDLLCKAVFKFSNINDKGELDLLGLAPERIRGYGLGVMNARAAFYANDIGLGEKYLKEGRVFGPHGEGLIVANSIKDYDDSISIYLTEKTKKLI
ncbi:lactate/malate family dehydrogenase [Caloramator sp. E03]|uniref:lactate/malate family dehydrogenase n=1 Tax=Caloramator sp. E03 TaxID=2576307 RepID=UPI001FA9D1C4|nr:lactate dehydrogenase [Caloramator sp. E03]